jgi:hypothetical protein
MNRFSRLVVAGLLASRSPPLGAQGSPMLTVTEHGDELLLDLGPIVIPQAGRNAVVELPSQRVAVPVGGWMHGYSVELVDRTGARVSPNLLHHVYVIAANKRELFSSDHLYIAAATGDTPSLALGRWIGYQMKKGDTLRVDAGFSDPTGRRWEGLHLRIHFPRTGSNSLIGAVAIYPFYVAVPAPLKGDSATIPPGRSEAFWEGRPAVPGRILGVSGHLPSYGVRLVLEDRTSHSVIWDVRPDTNAAGEARAIPVKRFLATIGVGIWPDHTYRLTVTYNNRTSAPISASGGWGILGGVFVLEHGVVWPAALDIVK